jgi:hypothetical protein
LGAGSSATGAASGSVRATGGAGAGGAASATAGASSAEIDSGFGSPNAAFESDSGSGTDDPPHPTKKGVDPTIKANAINIFLSFMDRDAPSGVPAAPVPLDDRRRRPLEFGSLLIR